MPSGAPLAYVSNEGSGDVTVIDTGTDSVVATIHVGKRPRGIRVSPDGQAVYVALSAPSPPPPGLDASTLPRADRSAEGIGVIDVATRRLVWELPSGSDPEQFAVSPDGSKLYISNEDAATATVVDIASRRVLQTYPVGGKPEGVDISPDGKLVYVSAAADHQVTVISTDSKRPIARFTVDKGRAASRSHPTARARISPPRWGGRFRS
jgi:YVTN family beta-propeller protein